MRRALPFVIAIAVAFATAGCGGGSGDQSTAGSLQTAQSAGSTAPALDKPTAAEKAADQAQAVAMTPTLSDMPTGWATDPDTKPRDHTCDIQKSDLTQTANTTNPHNAQFTNEDSSVNLLGGAVMLHTGAMASTAYDRQTSNETLQCVADNLEKGVKENADPDVEVGDAKLSEVSFSTIGEQSKLARIEIPITTQGQHASVYVDYLVYRVGRGLGLLAAVSEFTPTDTTMFQELAETLAKRGQAAEPVAG